MILGIKKPTDKFNLTVGFFHVFSIIL